MKKFIYFIAIILVLGFGFMVWKNYPAVSTVNNTAPTVSDTPSTTQTSNTATTTPFVESTYLSKAASSTLGDYITDKNKRALYVFTKDTIGVSNCTGECLAKWPVYGPGVSMKELLKLPLPPAGFNAIERADGVVQYTWKGRPLYYFAADTAAGDTKGHTVGGVWFLIEAK